MSTIKDVAKLSGVSIATVSNFINGKTVREENKLRIEHAIDQLQYEVNSLARSFRTKETKSIGVIVNTLVSTFNMVILHSAERILQKYGYSMVICNSEHDTGTERLRVKFLMDKHVDGIIVFPVAHDTYFDDIVDQKIPVVYVDRITKSSSYPAVVVDNINASYEATEYLIRNGHQRIGLISGHMLLSTGVERLEGYKRAHYDYGISIDEDLLKNGAYTKEAGYEFANQLLECCNPPTAIYVTSHELLLGVTDAVRDHSISIPDDLSLITFDHFEYTDNIRPLLTYVKQPYDLLGIETSNLILKLIKNKNKNSPKVIRLKAELTVRDSVKAITLKD